MVFDANFKLIDSLKVVVDKIKIVLNIGDNKISIDASDHSQNIHYHSEIGLLPEVILKLPPEDIVNLIKHQTYLTLKAACLDNPEEMQKLDGIYKTVALTTGAATLTASSISNNPDLIIPNPKEPQIPIMPAVDFVSQVSSTIQNMVISVGNQNIEVEVLQPIIKIKNNTEKSDN